MEIMDIIITTPKAEYTDAAESAEIKYLKFKNRQLEEENEILLAMLAEAIGNKILLIDEEKISRKPKFRIDENLGGNVLISVIR